MERLVLGKVWTPAGSGPRASFAPGKASPATLDTPFPKAGLLQANTELSKCV